jgi:hypothetical protein
MDLEELLKSPAANLASRPYTRSILFILIGLKLPGTNAVFGHLGLIVLLHGVQRKRNGIRAEFRVSPRAYGCLSEQFATSR